VEEEEETRDKEAASDDPGVATFVMEDIGGGLKEDCRS
jgi:hypothetical protein